MTSCALRIMGILAVTLFVVVTLTLNSAADEVVVLRTASDEIGLGTMWRYFETWRNDIVRLKDGTLMPVDVLTGNVALRDARRNPPPTVKRGAHVLGSAFPPENWRKVDFDDGAWVRHRGPMPCTYRSLSLVCGRGKFHVSDPPRVETLELAVSFQGGAVATLNGREIGRAYLPAGNLTHETLAEDYPSEAFVDAKNKLLTQPRKWGRMWPLASSDPRGGVAMRDADKAKRIKLRARSMEVTIPRTLLRKGLNILTVEIHRAPAIPIMFTSAQRRFGHYYGLGGLWNRAQVETIELRASADAGAIVPNIARPDGLQVWNEDVFTPIWLPDIGVMRYADPNERPASISLLCVKNGVSSGQLIVGSRKTLKGLNVTVSPLTGNRGTIPVSAMQIGYLNLASGALESAPPTLKTPPKRVGRRMLKDMDPAVAGAIGVIQPVWLTVKVPRNARAGIYSGTMKVVAEGGKLHVVPVRMKVIGDWVAPDPFDFKTWVAAHESPDSVAMQYNVPLWSKEHWRHLDRVYSLLTTVGLKDIHLPLIAKTHLCNEQSMVRWIRKADGSYDHDFSVFKRYLDVAVKHLGKVPVVCIQIYDYGFRTNHKNARPVNVRVTELDPATGKVSDFTPPAWGTPESLKFWKPVIKEIRRILAERGLEKSMMFGMGSNNTVKAECINDLKTLAPDIPWVNRTHYYAANVGQGRSRQPVGFTANVGPVIGVYWDPAAGKSHYAWRNPSMVVHFPRQGNVSGTVFQKTLASYRIFAEGIQLSHGQRYKSHSSVHGIGHIGVDYWPVMKGPRGRAKSMSGRYVFWHSLGLDQVIQSIVSPGAKGAVPSPRLQLMRESLQEAEARIFVQDSLLDKDKAARLGDALAKRCRKICDQRTQLFRYISAFSGLGTREDCFRTFSRRAWEAHSEKLYQAAGDVAKALAE